VNEYLILDLCLIANKILLFITWNLVWFDVYIVRLEFEYSSMFFAFFIFLGVWYVFVRKFNVFLVLILFWFESLFWFSVRLNLDFLFGSCWTSIFRLTRSGQNQVRLVKPCLVCQFFLLKEFWVKDVFDKHAIKPVLTTLFWRKIWFCQTWP